MRSPPPPMMTFQDLVEAEQHLRSEAERMRRQLDQAEELLLDVRVNLELLGLIQPEDDPQPKAEPDLSDLILDEQHRQAKKKPQRRRTHAQIAECKQAILAEIEAGANAKLAARRCNVAYSMVHKWKKTDPEFKAGYERACKARSAA